SGRADAEHPGHAISNHRRHAAGVLRPRYRQNIRCGPAARNGTPAWTGAVTNHQSHVAVAPNRRPAAPRRDDRVRGEPAADGTAGDPPGHDAAVFESGAPRRISGETVDAAPRRNGQLAPPKPLLCGAADAADTR